MSISGLISVTAHMAITGLISVTVHMAITGLISATVHSNSQRTIIHINVTYCVIIFKCL